MPAYCLLIEYSCFLLLPRTVVMVLILNVPPKTHILKAYSPGCGITGRLWKLEEMEPPGRCYGHWGCVFSKGIIGHWPLLFLFWP